MRIFTLLCFWFSIAAMILAAGAVAVKVIINLFDSSKQVPGRSIKDADQRRIENERLRDYYQKKWDKTHKRRS